MKLHEGAVLLIIGAAVIGPLKAERVLRLNVQNHNAEQCLVEIMKDPPYTSLDATGGDNTREHWKRRCARITKYGDETTAETCARVMKEIDAKKIQPVMFVPGLPDDTAKLKKHWELDGERVRCIPAPTGLVK